MHDRVELGVVGRRAHVLAEQLERPRVHLRRERSRRARASAELNRSAVGRSTSSSSTAPSASSAMGRRALQTLGAPRYQQVFSMSQQTLPSVEMCLPDLN